MRICPAHRNLLVGRPRRASVGSIQMRIWEIRHLRLKATHNRALRQYQLHWKMAPNFAKKLVSKLMRILRVLRKSLRALSVARWQSRLRTSQREVRSCSPRGLVVQASRSNTKRELCIQRQKKASIG